MLSHQMIQMIEGHWQAISTSVIARVRRDSELPHLRRLADSELLDWGSATVKNLGRWMAGHDSDLARHYEHLGSLRYRESIPLHEAVRGLQYLKDELVEFVRDRTFPQSSLELYAEEELEHRLNQFFDWLVFHLVRGYEQTLRKAAHMEVEFAAAR